MSLRTRSVLLAVTDSLTWLGAVLLLLLMMAGFGFLSVLGVAVGADAGDAVGYLVQMLACSVPAAVVGSVVWHSAEYYRAEREFLASRRLRRY